VKRTWEGVARALGLHDFSPESQDKGAWYLAQHAYHATTGRDLLGDLRSHHFDPAGLAGTWVSMAKRTGSWMQHFFNPNMARALSHHEAGMHGEALRHMFGHPHHSRESAIPPARQQHIVVNSPVHLDGRIISQNTEHHMVARHRFAHGTADHDGRAGVPHVDYMSIA
jgi:hypothetical protein